jgi:hypothetical protein
VPFETRNVKEILRVTMITESLYPSVEIPDVDLWGFFFERKTPFPDDKGIDH